MKVIRNRDDLIEFRNKLKHHLPGISIIFDMFQKVRTGRIDNRLSKIVLAANKVGFQVVDRRSRSTRISVSGTVQKSVVEGTNTTLPLILLYWVDIYVCK